LKGFCHFCGLAYADEQHSGRKWIESAGMADLQVLFVKMPACRPFHLADNIGRCPAIGLVNGNDDSFRVIFNAVSELVITRKEFFVHY